MSNVKYLHYRQFDVDGNTLSRTGATVAYMVGPTGSNYAIAYCGPYDNYNKSLGRAKAGGRLLSEKYAKAGKHTDISSFVKEMDILMFEDAGYSRASQEN